MLDDVNPYGIVADTKRRIDSLRDYLLAMESASQLHKDNLVEQMKMAKKEYGEQSYEFSSLEEQYCYQHSDLYEANQPYSSIEQHQSYSAILLIYMLFESHLLHFTWALNSIRNNSIFDPTPFKSIDRIKKHLKKDMAIYLGQFEEWDALMDLKLIRHCLIHSSGIIEGGDLSNRIPMLEKKYQGQLFAIQEFSYMTKFLLIRPSLCQIFLDKVQLFFEKLFEVSDLNHERSSPNKFKNENVSEADTDVASTRRPF